MLAATACGQQAGNREVLIQFAEATEHDGHMDERSVAYSANEAELSEALKRGLQENHCRKQETSTQVVYTCSGDSSWLITAILGIELPI
jgi:hypothetical protein